MSRVTAFCFEGVAVTISSENSKSRTTVRDGIWTCHLQGCERIEGPYLSDAAAIVSLGAHVLSAHPSLPTHMLPSFLSSGFTACADCNIKPRSRTHGTRCASCANRRYRANRAAKAAA